MCKPESVNGLVHLSASPASASRFCLTAEHRQFCLPKTRKTCILEVLDADYIAAHRTDAISERAREIMENDLF